MSSQVATIDLEEERLVSSDKVRRFDQQFKAVAVSLLLISIAFVVCVFVLVKENRDLNDKLNEIQSQITQNSYGSTSVPKNIIFFVTDGMGPAQVTLAREVLRTNTGNPFATLQCDPLLVGTSRTKAANSRIPDSAAGATAFASGVKTDNEYVGVDANGKAFGTILEAAKANGLATGMVVTKSVTDATPASFSAHNIYRGNEAAIALFQSTAGLDIIFGGGTNFYNSTILADMQSRSYTVLNSTSFYTATPQAPVIGLFAPVSMDYEIDRTTQPSLSEMTQKALQILSTNQKANDKGFFLLVEASQIDIGCHDNDPATFIAELLEWDKTLEIAKQYQQQNPSTLIISLSDHETGGLAMAGGAYVPRNSTHYAVEGAVQAGANDQHETQAATFLYNPNLGTTDFDLEMRYYYVITPFLGANTSIRTAVTAIKSGITNGQNPNAAQIVQQNLNLTLTATELETLNDAITRQWNFTSAPSNMTFNNQYYSNPIHYALTVIVSTRAGISWSTKGHSGVDINVYASGPGSNLFGGSRENTEFPGILSRLMNWNLDTITKSLSGVNVGTCPYQDQRCGINPP